MKWCNRVSFILFVILLTALPGTACRAPLRVSRTGEHSVNPNVNREYRGARSVEEWAERFESESREIYRERERIVAASGIEPGMDIADVGAGTGFFTLLFARRVGPDGTVFSVDIKPEFLERIDALAEERDIQNIQTVRCADDSIELAADSVDLVFLCDTYHHFEFPQSTLASIHAALRPGGRLVVIDFERIPGKSRAWVLNHVRDGKEVVIREIESAGFTLIDEVAAEFLKENYILRFAK